MRRKPAYIARLSADAHRERHAFLYVGGKAMIGIVGKQHASKAGPRSLAGWTLAVADCDPEDCDFSPLFGWSLTVCIDYEFSEFARDYALQMIRAGIARAHFYALDPSLPITDPLSVCSMQPMTDDDGNYIFFDVGS